MGISSVWIFDKESREDLRKALAESPRETVEKFINRDSLRSLLFTCEEYERRIEDKDASIQQLIEQLEKAEAQITDLARLAAVDIAQDRAGRIEDLEKWAGVVLFELEAGPSAQRDRLIREGVTLLNTPARTFREGDVKE